MSKKEKFVNFVKELMAPLDQAEIDPDVMEYWLALSEQVLEEKPALTANGKLILAYMQAHPETHKWAAKAIGEELGMSSRTPAGAMRKLTTDGFIEKIGQNPTMYVLTEKGKNFEIIEEEEN